MFLICLRPVVIDVVFSENFEYIMPICVTHAPPVLVIEVA